MNINDIFTLSKLKSTPFLKRSILVVAGVFLTLLVLEIFMRTAGFFLIERQEYKNKTALNRPQDIVIMCIGESTTADSGSSSAWPRQLENILNKRQPELKFKVINKGFSEVDTDILLSELPGNLSRYNPDIVIAMMGINDGFLTARNNTRFSHGFKTALKKSRVYSLFFLISLNIESIRQAEGLLNFIKRNLSRESTEHSYSDIQQLILHAEPDKARKELLELQKTHPDDYMVYKLWGLFYWFIDLDKCIEMYEKSLALNPDSFESLSRLGEIYLHKNDLKKAEDIFRRIIDKSPYAFNEYIFLSTLLVDKKEHQEAINILKKALKIFPDNSILFGLLNRIHYERGDSEGYKTSLDKIHEIYSSYYNPKTKINYHKLITVTLKQGIMLFCVGYPMRPIEGLKYIITPSHNLRLIDNELIFKNAVNSGSYAKYFTDRFAGDFGHCTIEGNKLLAENIATEVLKYTSDKHPDNTRR